MESGPCWWRFKCQYRKPILFPEDRWHCEIYGNARLYDEKLLFWRFTHILKEDQFCGCGPVRDRCGHVFLMNAIRWRKWLGAHGGNISVQHRRKYTPIICRFVFLSGDEIPYIVNEDSLKNDSTGMCLAFQPLHESWNYSIQQVSLKLIKCGALLCCTYPPHPPWTVSCHGTRTAAIFLLIWLTSLVWLQSLWGVKHAGNGLYVDCADLPSPPGPVSEVGAFSHKLLTLPM